MAIAPVEIIVGELAQAVTGRRVDAPDCVYAFSLTGPGGGDFHLRVAHGLGTVARGLPAASDCHVSLGADDALRLVRGRLNPVTAYFSGRIRVQGDLGAAARLGQLLRPR